MTKLDLLAIFLFTLLALFINYSGFGHTNHVEQIPLFFRMLDKNYLTRDWFINTVTTGFDVRKAFNWLTLVVYQLMGNLEISYFLILLASLSLIFIFSYLLVKLVGGNHLSIVFFFALLLFGRITPIGGNGLLVWYLTPGIVATASAIVSTFLFLRRKPLASLVILAGTCYLQLVIGLQFFLLFLTAAFIQSIVTRNRFQFFPWAIFALLILPLISSQASSPVLSSSQAVEILAEYRSPWHYRPSFFSPQDYAVTAVVALGGALVLFLHRQRIPPSTLMSLTGFLLACLVLFLIGYVFVEVIPIKHVVFLQPLRVNPLLHYFSFLIMAYSLSRLKHLAVLLRSLLTLVSFTSFLTPLVSSAVQLVYLLSLIQTRFSLWFGLISAILFFLGINKTFISQASSSSLLALTPLLFIATWLLFRRKLSPLSGFAFQAILIIIFSWLVLKAHPLWSRYHLPPSEEGIYTAVRELTPPESLFMVPPAQLMSFRLVASRALYIDWKSVPLSESGLKEYYTRNLQVADLYSQAPTQNLIAFSRIHGINFVIDNTSRSLFLDSDLPIVYSDEWYTLYQIPK